MGLAMVAWMALAGCKGEPVLYAQSLRAWPVRDEAEPTSESLCGTLFYCGYNIRCEDGVINKIYDSWICPKVFKLENSRAAVWAYWQPRVRSVLLELDSQNHGLCWIREANCYAEPRGEPYGNYPN